jgi:UDP-2,4-diacetamido-2,4,6-trideoxy-beta-L-altropyranose hydrolase
MKVAFFTEAGNKRGMGHLVRSYTIAQKFKDNLCEVDFFLDSDIDFSYKFDYIQSFSWDSFSLKKEYDVIFIDSYEASLDTYQEASRNSKIAVFLDDDNRLNYPAGVIINFAPDANQEYFQTKEENKKYLLGLDYIPIRSNFLTKKIQKKENIFIMLGGTDSKNLSQEILESLQDITIPKTIVSNNPIVKSELEKFENTQVLYKPNDSELIENMMQSSFAISTASMTLYELAYLKIPTISLSLNQNQHNGAKQSYKYNITKSNISIEDKNWKHHLHQEMQNLIKSKDSFQITTQIDGLGTQRIFDFIARLIQ